MKLDMVATTEPGAVPNDNLIDATARVLARDGATGASVRTIAIEAGVSPGLVNHHFAGVDALIAATYVTVAHQVAEALENAVAKVALRATTR